jgi:hypothetical protein
VSKCGDRVRGGFAAADGAFHVAVPPRGTYEIMPADGGAPVRFATRDGNSFLTGGLDEVAIYPRELTGAEIVENYTVGIS